LQLEEEVGLDGAIALVGLVQQVLEIGGPLLGLFVV
jgi:hypothetical protein